MLEVQRAIHVRTGQRVAADALDGWLARHGVRVDGFGDVYETCVHLLTNYEQTADLALVGMDWLSDDECAIIPYLRQTWPRVGLVLYGAALNSPLIELLPMTLACRLGEPIRQLLAGTPQELLQRMSTKAAVEAREGPPRPRGVPEAGPALEPRPRTSPVKGSAVAGGMVDAGPSCGEAPRSILTAEELAALLQDQEER